MNSFHCGQSQKEERQKSVCVDQRGRSDRWISFFPLHRLTYSNSKDHLPKRYRPRILNFSFLGLNQKAITSNPEWKAGKPCLCLRIGSRHLMKRSGDGMKEGMREPNSLLTEQLHLPLAFKEISGTTDFSKKRGSEGRASFFPLS